MAQKDFDGLWAEATRRYAESVGKHLTDIPMPRTSEDLINDVKVHNTRYKHFREKQADFFHVVSAVTKPIELVGNFAAGAASATFPPSQMVFGAVMYLINAAKGVSATLDAILELFIELKECTVRLKIYLTEELSDQLREKLTETLTVVIEILAVATKMVEDGMLGRIILFGKNVLVGNDKRIQSLINRLEKLTKNEDLLVGAETLTLTKRTERVVESVHVSIETQDARLRKMSLGMRELLNASHAADEETKLERSARKSNAVRDMLEPSFLAEDCFHAIKREYLPDSGDWIWTEDHMQALITSKKPLLWISGNPGSGKSFLIYNIVTRLEMARQIAIGHSTRVSIGYFFFRDNQDQTRSFEKALRDVAYQIAQTNPVYARYIEALSQSSPVLSSVQSVWRKLFLDFFMQRPAHGSPTFLVLDGIDEAYKDDRAVFFDLLTDFQRTGGHCNFHVVMTGRPHVVEEMTQMTEKPVPTIYVDRLKTSGDISRYVSSSISKSKVLNRVSKPLKTLIVQTLSTKAEGMFMWVKLMITELSKKTRESAIRDALNKAPAGLTKMLRHVLENFSAALTEEDANDFNNMLLWVALAKQPLTLEQLDIMLRLQSSEGDAVLFLEGKLRKQYASFFTLTRDDSRSTADLLMHKSDIDDDADQQTSSEVIDGLEDVENETDFNSNPKTTIVAFSHSSVSDFLRKPNEGKVKAVGADYPAIGVDFNQDQFSVAQTCIELLVDNTLLDRMSESSALLSYAGKYWKHHLDDAGSSADINQNIQIGISIAKMMQDESSMELWCKHLTASFCQAQIAQQLLVWILTPQVLEALTEEAASWYQSIEGDPLQIFEPAMRYVWSRWLYNEVIIWGDCYCCSLISSYILRREGIAVDVEQVPPVELIERSALWQDPKKTAQWYRVVGRTMREYQWYEVGMKYFEAALEIQPGWLAVYLGVMTLYVSQKKYIEAIHSGEDALKSSQSEEAKHLVQTPFAENDVYELMGLSYRALAKQRTGEGTIEERHSLLERSLQCYSDGFYSDKSDYVCVTGRFEVLQDLMIEAAKFPNSKALSRSEHSDEVMRTLYQLENAETEGNTNLISFIQNNPYEHTSYGMSCLLDIFAAAAAEKCQIEWLRSIYRRAIVCAENDLQSILAIRLKLALAELYSLYDNQPDKALRIWEGIGLSTNHIAGNASPMASAREMALNQLGQYCIRKALEDDSQSNHYVTKMESIVARRRRVDISNFDTWIPPNDVALHLASWYHGKGRDSEAREVIRPHIQDAIMILSDDDPSNDRQGFWMLKRALIAIGDDRNAFAILHAHRKYENGLSFIRGWDEYEFNPDEGDSSGLTWRCDGICGRLWHSCDGMIQCRYCNIDLCSDCHRMLLRDELPKRMCGKEHAFVTVPYLLPGQIFKEGETLVDGQIVTLERWKADIEKQYNL